MPLIAGIDPGNNGAVAVYDVETRRLISVEDIPVWFQTVGKKKRKRIDTIGLMELFDTLNMIGVDLVVLEAVGGRPRQSASAGFVFGYTVGLIYMSCMYSKIMVETVQPSKWKKIMNIPGKQGNKDFKDILKKMPEGKEKNQTKRNAIKGAEGDILKRAGELFPHDMGMFKTERGGLRMDRIDAAFLAKFGGDFVYRTMQPGDDLDLAYRNVEIEA